MISCFLRVQLLQIRIGCSTDVNLASCSELKTFDTASTILGGHATCLAILARWEGTRPTSCGQNQPSQRCLLAETVQLQLCSTEDLASGHQFMKLDQGIDLRKQARDGAGGICWRRRRTLRQGRDRGGDAGMGPGRDAGGRPTVVVVAVTLGCAGQEGPASRAMGWR
jgi:hypothetical protein